MIAMLHMYFMLFIFTHTLSSLTRGIFIVPNKGTKWRKQIEVLFSAVSLVMILAVSFMFLV
jgi:hypothetical protein